PPVGEAVREDSLKVWLEHLAAAADGYLFLLQEKIIPVRELFPPPGTSSANTVKRAADGRTVLSTTTPQVLSKLAAFVKRYSGTTPASPNLKHYHKMLC
ncbi:unnamed protein product, partial [Chrysoparadoxa australica]